MAEIPAAGVTDREILRSVAVTVRDVLLPALREDAEWAQAVARQLAGLADYAAARAEEPIVARLDEIAAALDALADNQIARDAIGVGYRSHHDSPAAVMAAAGAVLAAAVGRDDAAADEVRRRLRTVLVRQLDDELAETAVLVDVFRGRGGG